MIHKDDISRRTTNETILIDVLNIYVYDIELYMSSHDAYDHLYIAVCVCICVVSTTVFEMIWCYNVSIVLPGNFDAQKMQSANQENTMYYSTIAAEEASSTRLCDSVLVQRCHREVSLESSWTWTLFHVRFVAVAHALPPLRVIVVVTLMIVVVASSSRSCWRREMEECLDE